MAVRSRKSVLKLLPLAGFALLIVAGLALAAMPARQKYDPSVRSTRASSSVSLEAGVSASPSVSPQVAGVQTAAPTPTSKPSAPAAPANTQRPLPQATPDMRPHVTLQLAINNSTTSASIVLTSHSDACTILEEARDEGKIKSVTLTYYASYQSDYVSEINGLKDNWTFKYNGLLPPVGCSKVPLKVGDTVTWQFQ